MCGLTGCFVGTPRRGQRPLALTTWLARLLVESEHRGPHATGVAALLNDGTMHVAKAALPASRFVRTAAYRDVCAHGTLFMGHTRWPTQGSHRQNQNNQPLLSPVAPHVALTHNGHLPMVDRYFAHFQLPRTWEVDSEVLLRLACRHVTPEGLALPALLQDLTYCAGQLAVVLAVASHPDEMIFIRRDKPLYLAYHAGMHLLAYASEDAILHRALPWASQWQIHPIPVNTAWVVHRQHLTSPVSYRW